jgi:hypothetical protein
MRAAAYHALFLVASALFAAYIWAERATPRGALPVLLEAGIDDMDSITYRWPHGETHVAREGEDKARVYVVTLTHEYDPGAEKRKAAAMSDPKNRLAIKTGKDAREIEAEAVAAAPPEPLVKETRTFPPGLFSIATIQKLTPFRARRSLGDIAADELAAMGLAKPQRSLAITAGRRELKLDLGNETYGGQAYYARQPGQDEVFLIDAEIVRTFETQPRNMMDSRIVTVPMSDVTGLEIEVAGRKAEFVHRNKDQFRARFFAPKDAPDAKSEAVDGLMSTFVGLKAAEFLSREPEGDELVLIRYLRDGAPPHDVRLYKKRDESGYTIRSGRWVAEIGEADGRKILEEARAALPAT